MADANLLGTINANGEADASMILDTLMYSDCLGDAYARTNYNGQTIEYIVSDMLENRDLTDENRNAVESVKKYLDAHTGSAVGQLKLSSASNQLGADYQGASGATFYSENSSGKVQDVYVAFRGTGEGRWYDNGDAFSKEYSPYQEDAAQYFDYAMEKLGVDESCNVITTGHSKGGNFSQYVALNSENAGLIDTVYSFDGQGFSPEAIASFKNRYGEEFYEQQIQKMYSISGDNDYVNVLGVKAIPEDHTVYIETPTEVRDFPNSHALYDGNGSGNLFDYGSGTFYNQTDKQRETALLAKTLNENIMSLPLEQREDVCRSLMSLMESLLEDEMTVGLNGETATAEEYLGLLSNIDKIVNGVIFTAEGQGFINTVINEMVREKLPFDENTPFGKFISYIVAGYIQMDLTGALVVGELLAARLAQLIAYGAKVAEGIYEFCSGVVDGITGVFEAIGEGVDGVFEMIGSLGEGIGNFFSGLFDWGSSSAVGPCQFQVTLPVLRSTSSDMQDIAKVLKQMSEAVGHEANNISFMTPGMFQVKRKLKDTKNELYNLSKITGRLASALSGITAEYEKREDNIIKAWY